MSDQSDSDYDFTESIDWELLEKRELMEGDYSDENN